MIFSIYCDIIWTRKSKFEFFSVDLFHDIRLAQEVHELITNLGCLG